LQSIMDDNTLLKISLFLTVGGIIALFFILETAEIQGISVSAAQNKSSGDFVKVYGIVENVISRDKVTSFSLNEYRQLDAVVFDNVSLENGLFVELEGKISEEEGKKTIIVDSIRIK